YPLIIRIRLVLLMAQGVRSTAADVTQVRFALRSPELIFRGTLIVSAGLPALHHGCHSTGRPDDPLRQNACGVPQCLDRWPPFEPCPPVGHSVGAAAVVRAVKARRPSSRGCAARKSPGSDMPGSASAATSSSAPEESASSARCSVRPPR